MPGGRSVVISYNTTFVRGGSQNYEPSRAPITKFLGECNLSFGWTK